MIAPRMGARFSQYLAVMEPGGTAGQPPGGVERVLYVLEGQRRRDAAGLRRALPRSWRVRLLPPRHARRRPGRPRPLASTFSKSDTSCGQASPSPSSLFGDERDVAGTPFMGDPDAILKVLLPRDPRFDLAVNVFTFQPGTTLPLVEVHVMEHGLLMLEGQGVYRLGDDWYPVQKGDVIWMAPFCPQWFVAMGKGPATLPLL